MSEFRIAMREFIEAIQEVIYPPFFRILEYINSKLKKKPEKYNFNVKYFLMGVRIDSFDCYECGDTNLEAFLNLKSKCTFYGYDKITITRI